jgi:hypothetical protein
MTEVEPPPPGYQSRGILKPLAPINRSYLSICELQLKLSELQLGKKSVDVEEKKKKKKKRKKN